MRARYKNRIMSCLITFSCWTADDGNVHPSKWCSIWFVHLTWGLSHLVVAGRKLAESKPSSAAFESFAVVVAVSRRNCCCMHFVRGVEWSGCFPSFSFFTSRTSTHSSIFSCTLHFGNLSHSWGSRILPLGFRTRWFFQQLLNRLVGDECLA